VTTLASDHQMVLSTWQQHTQSEFVLKDAALRPWLPWPQSRTSCLAPPARAYPAG
jgi:hypothetical protein